MVINSIISDWIVTGLLRVVWRIFISGPLAIIAWFNEVFKFLSGELIQKLMFDTSGGFSFSAVPTAFWGFCIFAGAMIVFIFWVQFIKLLFSESKEMSNKFVVTLRMTAFSAVVIFFIPIGFFMLNQIVIFFTNNIGGIFGHKDGNNIAGRLWYLGDWGWDGLSEMDKEKVGLAIPDRILQYNMIIEIFAVWLLMIAFGVLAILLIQKNIELFFLLIISPIVATTMVNDQGKRLNTWKDMVIAKSIVTSATIVSYYIFMLVLEKVHYMDLSRFGVVGKQILLVALICGGALACFNASTIVASLVGENVGMREGMSSLTSMMAVASGLKMGTKAIGSVGGFMGLKKRKTDSSNDKKNKNGGNGEGGTNEKEEDEDFKVPHINMSERSGAVGFLGDVLRHGVNGLYSAAQPIIDRVKSDKFRSADGIGAKSFEIAKGVGEAAVVKPLKKVFVDAPKAIGRTGTGIGNVVKQRHTYETSKKQKNQKPIVTVT